jgi:hypothetical protein
MDSVLLIKDGVRGGKSIQLRPDGHQAMLQNHVTTQSLQSVMLLKLHNEMEKAVLFKLTDGIVSDMTAHLRVAYRV